MTPFYRGRSGFLPLRLKCLLCTEPRQTYVRGPCLQPPPNLLPFVPCSQLLTPSGLLPERLMLSVPVSLRVLPDLPSE